LYFCNIAFQKQKFAKLKNAKYLSINMFYFILADWGDLQEIGISYWLSAHYALFSDLQRILYQSA